MSRPFLTKCPVGCAAPPVETGIVLPEGSLRRCPECGQLISSCSAERYLQSMQEFDDEEGTLPKTDAIKRRFVRSRRYLEQIEYLLDKPRRAIRLLDVGCSSGYFLGVAQQMGFSAEGVEPGRRAVLTARAAGLTVHEGLLEDVVLPEQNYDAITMFEVIEHVPDALAVTQRCRRLLQPRGVVVIGTGNTQSWTFKVMKSRWEYLHIDRHGGHVSFFNPHSINALAARSGFAVERIQTRSVSLIDKNEAAPAVYRAARILCEIMEAPSRWLKRGHDMLVFMRKKGN